MAAPTKQQRAEPPWRQWYKLARWRRLKDQVHQRDGYVCQRTGVLCDGVHPAPNSPVADHKRPHRGDAALFWDPDNIHTVSKAYHDAEKQKQEQTSLHQRGVWD
jgi:5-methylcytosine-specific restriction endonuclease McrA